MSLGQVSVRYDSESGLRRHLVMRDGRRELLEANRRLAVENARLAEENAALREAADLWIRLYEAQLERANKATPQAR